MSDNIEVRFTQSARKHRIGRNSARFVMAHAAATVTITKHGTPARRYVGRDDRGRELEIVAVELTDSETGDLTLLVIHVMPTQLRSRGHDPDG